MDFRRTLCSILALATLLSARVGLASPVQMQTHPLGIVIRKNFIGRTLEYFRQIKTPIRIEDCIGNHLYIGDLSVDADHIDWIASTESDRQRVNIGFKVNQVDFVGRIQKSCTDLNAPTEYYQIKIKNHEFGVFVNVDSLSFQFESGTLPRYHPPRLEKAEAALDPSLLLTPQRRNQSIVEVKIGLEGHAQQIFSAKEVNAAIEGISKFIEMRLNNWVMERLRGLYFIEPLERILGEGSFWTKGVQIDKGAISLSNDAATKAQRQIAFALFADPVSHRVGFKKFFAGPNGLELFFNSAFLDPNELHELSLKGPEFDFREQATALQDRISTSQIITNGSFSRPSLPPSEADFDLVVANDLFTDALRSIYLQGMLRFRSSVDLGIQTREVLFDEAPSVKTVIQISPHAAPEMGFNANQLELSVNDYSLDLGTYLEDRVIPSEKILANVSVSTQLKIDSERDTVNLKVLPKTFKVGIRSLFKNLGENEVEILELLTTSIWEDFFNNYPDMVLFPTLVSTDQAPLEITGIKVSPKYTVLQMRVDWEKMK